MRLSAPVFHLKRQAKNLARELGIPLYKALDQIAAREGFTRWSLLAATAPAGLPASELFSRLDPGDLVLIGARPGQGKTLMGLRLAVQAMKAGRRSAFFTLEYTAKDVVDRLRAIGGNRTLFDQSFELDHSNAICADYIIERLAEAPNGTLAVIDYLQILDQKRDRPDLTTQVQALRGFARQRGLIIVFISQIDRSYDPSLKPCPDLRDIRLPNPLDLALFDKAVCLSNGAVRFQTINE
ncbi:DNA helicase [Phyllobacterium pellucidum]|uniref:DNA helicase n=1 Tax=Phyllobacterium pellucidum TaxID=2740464 RepID=UPI001D14442F|nr:DNA helicase [Phyllobacterium sp. T1018]UGY08846.1 DNA helicase [Phyllobacterium sp. T1018]